MSKKILFFLIIDTKASFTWSTTKNNETISLVTKHTLPTVSLTIMKKNTTNIQKKTTRKSLLNEKLKNKLIKYFFLNLFQIQKF